MKNDFLLAITQLAAERNLPKDLVFKAVEAALLSTYKNYDISVNILPGSGEIKVYAQKTVVKSPTDSWREITLSDARKIQKNIGLDDKIKVEINPLDAGRIGVQTAKQVVMQRLREAEHEFIFGTFAHREGDILNSVIQRIDARQIIVDLGQAEGLLPLSEQVRAEHYRAGQRIKVYLLEVTQTSKGPRLLLSRTHPNLVKRLFELEVPEIGDGIVELKAVAREAGFRTKIAVAAKQDEIDPVGSCIGLRGIRIQNIINELQSEKIDVIEWDIDPKTFIANALSPARVLRVILNHEDSTSIVIVPDGQLSLAIGREGQNARLAAKLTGWKIDIKSASAAAEENYSITDDEAISEEIEEPVAEEIVEAELPEEDEPEEELALIEEVPEERPYITEGPVIRFAEEILPATARTVSDPEKSQKKKKKKAAEKKTKRAKKTIIEDDELDDDLEDDLEIGLVDDLEDDTE
ncbi:MAG: transcription termination factor NusA [Chloroflexota bacterium]|nr:transcription termination factor NusA [Chloroflexota bacterium]